MRRQAGIAVPVQSGPRFIAEAVWRSEQAEGVTVGVEQHPYIVLWLRRGQRGAGVDRPRSCGIQVIDGESRCTVAFCPSAVLGQTGRSKCRSYSRFSVSPSSCRSGRTWAQPPRSGSWGTGGSSAVTGRPSNRE